MMKLPCRRDDVTVYCSDEQLAVFFSLFYRDYTLLRKQSVNYICRVLMTFFSLTIYVTRLTLDSDVRERGDRK